MSPTIVVAGSLAQRPGNGGHAWVFLQYLHGLRTLGYDVHFVDRLDAAMCVDDAGRPVPLAASANLRWLDAVMSSAGFASCWTVLSDRHGVTAGLGRDRLRDVVRRSVVLINVMGYLDDAELLDAAPLRVFLDIDPGFPQLWRALGLHDAFVSHDRFVTVGTRIGTDASSVPTADIDWLTTVPPVALAQWPAIPPPNGPVRFTTVATWRGPFGPIEYGGRTYGLRVHEFRRFLDLPRRTGATFDVALDIDEYDGADRQRLVDAGWGLVDPDAAAGTPQRYQAFIHQSGAELTIAKNLYVDTRGGWFSDRSACYLASGRPVVAQDTGFSDVLPSTAGLVAFTTLDEAAAAVDEVRGDYRRHACAAREIAEEHFAAERVLGTLLGKVGAV